MTDTTPYATGRRARQAKLAAIVLLTGTLATLRAFTILGELLDQAEDDYARADRDRRAAWDRLRKDSARRHRRQDCPHEPSSRP